MSSTNYSAIIPLPFRKACLPLVFVTPHSAAVSYFPWTSLGLHFHVKLLRDWPWVHFMSRFALFHCILFCFHGLKHHPYMDGFQIYIAKPYSPQDFQNSILKWHPQCIKHPVLNLSPKFSPPPIFCILITSTTSIQARNLGVSLSILLWLMPHIVYSWKTSRGSPFSLYSCTLQQCFFPYCRWNDLLETKIWSCPYSA